MDYREKFVAEFDPVIEGCEELMDLLRKSVVSQQKTIDNSQNDLKLQQISHYIKFCFVGLYEEFSMIKERLTEITEFRKLSQKLPYRVIVSILSFFEIRMKKNFKVQDYYAYFIFDPMRKIFQIFHTMNHYYSKELPLSTRRISIMNWRHLDFASELHNFPDLMSLDLGEGVLFPKLHRDSIMKIKKVSLVFDPNDTRSGLYECKNLKTLTINRIAQTATSPVYACKKFPNLESLEIIDGNNLNQFWHFHELKSLKTLRINGSQTAFNRAEIVLLLSSCPLLENFEFGNYSNEVNFPFLYLFFSYGYQLKKIILFSCKCSNWSFLQDFQPTSEEEYRMESILLECYGINNNNNEYFFPSELFHFMCKHYSKLISANFTFPKEGETTRTGMLDDLSDLKNLKKLKNLKFSNSLFQTQKKKGVPLSLDFCSENLEGLFISGCTEFIPEFIILENPSQFKNLKIFTISISSHRLHAFDHEIQKYGLDEGWINKISSLPALTTFIFFVDSFRFKNWYLILMIPTLKIFKVESFNESLFKDYSFKRENCEQNKADLEISKKLIIPENSSLEYIEVRHGGNFPWCLVYEVTKKCKKLIELTLNEQRDFDDERLVEKYAQMTEYIFKNMSQLPDIYAINFCLPAEVMEKREFGRQNMFKFSNKDFVSHRAIEVQIFQRMKEEEEEEGEEEEEKEESFLEKCKNLFEFKRVFFEEFEKKKRELMLLEHEMHKDEFKEIKKNFSVIDGLQILVLPRPIILRILQQFYEFKLKAYNHPVRIKDVFGYFRLDEERKIHLVFSSVVFLRCHKYMNLGPNDSMYFRFHSIRCENSAKDFRLFSFPFGVPKILDVKKGTCSFFLEDYFPNLISLGEEEKKKRMEENNYEEKMIEKRNKLELFRCFERLEKICFFSVDCSVEFIEMLGKYNNNIKKLDFVYCNLSKKMIEAFVTKTNWEKNQLHVFRIVQYSFDEDVDELLKRLKEKYPCFMYLRGIQKKKKKKKKKVDEEEE